MRVLMAIEPRSYREVIGAAIRGLRPHLEVVIVDPDALEPEMARLDPELVVCNRPIIAATSGGARLGRVSPLRAAGGENLRRQSTV